MAPQNRTLKVTDEERERGRARLLTLHEEISDPAVILDRTIHQDVLEAARLLPRGFVDLLLVDPPYNLTKAFGERKFRRIDTDDYAAWTAAWLDALLPTLKPDATVYVCGDWSSSVALYPVLASRLTVRNRLTWEREKGRGAKSNWKNASEDVWFCTVGRQYYFDVEAVKLRRQVIAPYRHASGRPKDWQETASGNGYRDTHPSNLWTDLSVPFWSMPENTDHPTQKPEKLVAKLILASCPPGGVVLDPFLGSGTTSVVARKLGRRYVGIEIDEHYCCLAERRLELAATNGAIQGYDGGVFWERNTWRRQRHERATPAGDGEGSGHTGAAGEGEPDFFVDEPETTAGTTLEGEKG